MGLLGKAIALNNANLAGTNAASGGALQALVADFHQKNPLFHGIVFKGASPDIGEMLAGHGAVCGDLPGGDSFVLLPGGLDRELFAHRLSGSTGLTALSQFSVNAPTIALEALKTYQWINP